MKPSRFGLGSFIALGALIATFGQGCGDAANRGDGFADGGTRPATADAGPTGPDNGGGDFTGDDDDENPTQPRPIENCATATAEAKRTPVYMLFILDGSGSMRDDNKWPAATEALNQIFNKYSGTADPALGVGFTIFQDRNDPGNYAGAIQVPIAVVDGAQRDRLRARLNTTWSGGTPLKEVLEGQYPLLAAFQPAPPLEPNGKRVMVVMTDGVPNGGATAQQQIEQMARARAQGTPPPAITTFAIGVGSPAASSNNYDVGFMGRLAAAGGTARPGCDLNERSNEARMCHFQVTPGGKSPAQIRDEFIAAIETIRSTVTSCDFALTAAEGAQIDPAKVNVDYTDGQGNKSTVLQDPQDGWSYDDPNAPTRVILNGQACERFKADSSAKVEIVLGCATKKPA
jgi:hypothetical protein